MRAAKMDARQFIGGRRSPEIDAIMEEVEHDPEVAQAAEEAQRELGTLTPEELRRQFTI